MHVFDYIAVWCAVQYVMCGPWEWLTLMSISTLPAVLRFPKSIALSLVFRTIAVVGFDLVYQQEHYQDIASETGYVLETVARIVLFNVTLLPLDAALVGWRRGVVHLGSHAGSSQAPPTTEA